MGVALLGSLGTLGGAVALGDHALLETARDAFTHGLQVAALGAGVVMAVAALVAWVTLRRVPAHAHAAADASAPHHPGRPAVHVV